MRRFYRQCGTILANLSLWLTLIMPSCGNQLIAQSPRYDRASKYYHLTSFTIGDLHISDAEVAVVGVSPRLDSIGREIVPLLRLSKAHISFVRLDGTELFTGELDNGTELDPAAELSGKFVWKGTEAHLVEMSTLRMRLKHSVVKTDFSSSHLSMPSSQSVFLSLRQPLTAEPIGGQIVISFGAATLTSVRLDVYGAQFNRDFHSSQPFQAQMDLSNEKLAINDAIFTSANLSSTVLTPLTDILSDAIVESGTLTFSTIKLIFSGEKIHADGDLRISDPRLKLKAYPDIQVVGLKDVLSPSFTGDIDSSRNSFQIRGNPSAPLVYVAQGDSNRVIDRINLNSRFLPDDFIPTGAMKIHFVRVSAAAEFLEAIGKATDDPKSLRILEITGANHVITKVEESSSNQLTRVLDPAILPILCGVSVDGYFGNDARQVVEALLNLPYQVERAPTSEEFSAAYLRLNPKFAPATAAGILTVTDFLTDRQTGEILNELPSSGNRQLSRLTSDLLLSGPESSRFVAGGSANDKRLLRPAKFGADRWKKPENRYTALGISAELPDMEAPEVSGIIKTPPTSTRGSLLRGRPGQYRDPRIPPHEPHDGVDIVANQTSMDKSTYAVHAVDSGRVAYARWNGAACQPKDGPACDPSANGYGYTVVIDHGNGTYTLYAHLATVASAGIAKLGQPVTAGEVIGYMADPANGEMSSGNARDQSHVRSSDRIQLHFEEFEAPPGRSSSDALSKIKNGSRTLDPTADLVANAYKPSATGLVLTHDQAGRLHVVQGFERTRSGVLSEAAGRDSAVSAIREEQRQTLKRDTDTAASERAKYQHQIENWDRITVVPATYDQKRAWEQQRQMNQGGGGYVGGIAPPGATPSPTPFGSGSSTGTGTPYCGTSTDGKTIQLCTQAKPPR